MLDPLFNLISMAYLQLCFSYKYEVIKILIFQDSYVNNAF